MLIASLDGQRIDAARADRGPDYCCPDCRTLVTLKKGRKVIHHFAHKPHSACLWGYGESLAHLEAKRIVADAFGERGYRVEIESPVPTLPGDRRADVMVWSRQPFGCERVAFELQHSAIGLDQIETRAFGYARAGVAQIWIPFLSPKAWKDSTRLAVDRFEMRYSARGFERWVHGLNSGRGMWMFEPQRHAFWLGRLSGHQLWVEESEWYDEDGEQQLCGGYHRWSRRYRDLTLTGPFRLADLELYVRFRDAFSTDRYRWPAGPVAHLKIRRPIHRPRPAEELEAPFGLTA